jgi:hypothetical protein
LQFSWLIQKDGFCVVEGEQRLNIALGLVLLEKLQISSGLIAGISHPTVTGCSLLLARFFLALA